MSKIFFEPWIGNQYHNGGIFKKKILIVGESHYCGGCDECGLKYNQHCTDLTTTKCIQDYLDPNCEREPWMKTFLKFERSLVNFETDAEDREKIWNSVAFFNFLQVAMNGARESGSPEDYEEGAEAFLEVINDLKPELIIVWGVGKLYYSLPEQSWEEGETVTVDGYNVLNGYYTLNDGHKSRIFFVYHPSVGYSWDWWYKVFSHFVK